MFLLYSNGTSVTGRALGRALGIPHGTNPRETREEYLIRWGSSRRVRYRPNTTLNTANAIDRTTNKFQSMGIMRDGHTRVPDYFLAENLDPNSIPVECFPVLGRRFNHTQGRDIVVCMQRTDVRMALDRGIADFFVSYIPTAREFRVHVFNDAVLKTSEKILTVPEQFRVPWMRNAGNGFTFRNPRDIPASLRTEIENQCVRAVQSLGLMFGAVDVVVGDNGSVYVLEVNTGPSLSDNSLDVYARAFANVLAIPEENLRLDDVARADLDDDVDNYLEGEDDEWEDEEDDVEWEDED